MKHLILLALILALPVASGCGGDAGTGNGGHAHADPGISHYTCPMHPSVESQDPDAPCPICGMDLVPVTFEELHSGVVTIDPQRRQEIGVRTEEARMAPLTVHVRTVGRVAYDESGLVDVTLKVRGWVGELFADTPGVRVKRGEPLFTLYSPELFAAQREYLSLLGRSRDESSERSQYLIDATRERLRLWDLTPGQIRELEERGEPMEQVPILSPADGYVVEKNVVEGGSIMPGDRILRIADLKTVWIEAEVYEADLPRIETGQRAVIELPYAPERKLEGAVTFVYPYLDPRTRTGRVRIEIDNPGLAFKPDMFANVDLTIPLGERLLVPESAVLRTGAGAFVFVDLGEGRLQPRAVELGARGEDRVEVTAGLTAGEIVVASGNFLIAAESRLKSALEQW